jgi:hypothetical protein
MKRNHWLIFAWIQVNGAIAAFLGIFAQWPTFLLATLLLLFPGSIASVAFVWWHGRPDWSPFTVGALSALSVIVNIVFLYAASFLLSSYRKSK